MPRYIHQLPDWPNFHWDDALLLPKLSQVRHKQGVLDGILYKARFWEKHATTLLNPRQILLINKLLGPFEGKLTSSKWAKIAKCSPDTALRDIQDLVIKEILEKEDGGGRSTSYQLR